MPQAVAKPVHVGRTPVTPYAGSGLPAAAGLCIARFGFFLYFRDVDRQRLRAQDIGYVACPERADKIAGLPGANWARCHHAIGAVERHSAAGMSTLDKPTRAAASSSVGAECAVGRRTPFVTTQFLYTLALPE